MTTPGHRPHHIRRAIGLALVSVFLFTAMSAIVKWIASFGYAATQITFFRAVFALLLSVPILLVQVGPAGFRTARPLGYVLRGFIGVFGTVFCFYGLANLPLADSVAIGFTMPLWVALLSAPVLGERVGLRRWLALLAGFAAILIIVPPTGAAPLVPALAALAGNGLIGLTLVLLRRLNATERPQTIVFYYMAALTLGTSILAPLDWRTPDSAHDFLGLAAVGIMAGLAHTVITHAYRYAPAAVVASFDYTGMLWGVLFGYLVWDERPGANLYVGAAIVIGCGLYILLSEGRHGRVTDPVGETGASRPPH
ncbi:MAG: DMT family transporter [Alphaproteobacteria bacterium]|nr:DMT family transporter [Alphaproteobacteria bacterium]